MNNLINDYRKKKHVEDLSYLSNLKNKIVDGFENEFSINNVQLFQPRTTRQSVGVGVGRKGIGIGTSKSFHSSTDQTIVDSGRLVMNQKGLRFIGATKQLGWDWKKIVEIQVVGNKLVIPVTNRQNISGVVLPLKPNVVKVIGTWLVDFANGDDISEQELSEPQDIDIMSKKNLGIAAVAILCLYIIAFTNPLQMVYDSEIIYRVETNCDSSRIEAYHNNEMITFQETVDIDDGVWEYRHEYNSVALKDDNNSDDREYVSLDASCRDENSNGDTPWVKVSVFVNGRLMATANEYDDSYAQCDVLFSLFANYEIDVHRDDCYHD